MELVVHNGNTFVVVVRVKAELWPLAEQRPRTQLPPYSADPHKSRVAHTVNSAGIPKLPSKCNRETRRGQA